MTDSPVLPCLYPDFWFFYPSLFSINWSNYDAWIGHTLLTNSQTFIEAERGRAHTRRALAARRRLFLLPGGSTITAALPGTP